jgi:hypothetical protein
MIDMLRIALLLAVVVSLACGDECQDELCSPDTKADDCTVNVDKKGQTNCDHNKEIKK